MSFKLRQVVQGVGLAELTGVDQAHEDIAHMGAMTGLVEQGVLSMQNRLLQRPFAEVVVQGRSGHAQEERQLLPVPQQVRHGLAQPGVRLHAALVKLPGKPDMEILHGRAALGLMKEQPLLGR